MTVPKVLRSTRYKSSITFISTTQRIEHGINQISLPRQLPNQSQNISTAPFHWLVSSFWKGGNFSLCNHWLVCIFFWWANCNDEKFWSNFWQKVGPRSLGRTFGYVGYVYSKHSAVFIQSTFLDRISPLRHTVHGALVLWIMRAFLPCTVALSMSHRNFRHLFFVLQL